MKKNALDKDAATVLEAPNYIGVNFSPGPASQSECEGGRLGGGAMPALHSDMQNALILELLGSEPR
jgi:hypothetical protein